MSRRVTLKFKTGSLAGRSYSLGPGEYFFIGSAENCAVRITDDPTVEATHAAIYYDPNGKILFKDMGTKNGTYVNGKKISKSVQLKPGQRATIGKFSTFQSSWWNALQATRLTRFSGLLRGKTDNIQTSIFASGKIAWGIGGVLVVIGLIYTWRQIEIQELRNQQVILDDDSNTNTNTNTNTDPSEKNHQVSNSRKNGSGMLDSIFNSKTFSATSKKPTRTSIEITPERQFIWDEIVSISRRFGNPPPSAMDPGFVREVERHIQKFTRRNHHLVLLQRKSQFEAIFERTLREKGLPAELGYIVWVESNYKIDARSPVGAAGLWQFMPETGIEYGLQVRGSSDERLNPEKATKAAADYFTSLLRMFGTERYLLAIASYNTGQNRVKRKQIATTVHKEHTSDFWQLRSSLPKETAEYVPKVIAAIIIGRNPNRYSNTSH